MSEKRHQISTNHHLKNLKQQEYDRNLIDLVIKLIDINDHDTLAFIARTSGIPPQLRHVVWPILLKYHPMCIAPNVLSNLIFWDPSSNSYRTVNHPDDQKRSTKPSDRRTAANTNAEAPPQMTFIKSDPRFNDESFIPQSPNVNKTNSFSFDNSTCSNNNFSPGSPPPPGSELERRIMRDLEKYFHSRVSLNSPREERDSESTAMSSTMSSPRLQPVMDYETEILTVLKKTIVNFLAKWSQVFRYESCFAWIALGLAEWFPPLLFENPDPEDAYGGPLVLTGRKHSHYPANTINRVEFESKHGSTSSGSANSTNDSYTHRPPYSRFICHLYKEYPLPVVLQKRLPESYEFTFAEMFERLILVIFHAPDCKIASEELNKRYPSNSPHLTNYIPVLSGGDLGFRYQLFFKIFASILPELYQPLSEESTLQSNSSRSSWIYWWIKCAGSRSLQRQDRARIWDLLLGWRPAPNMHTINFFLNYNINNKHFSHIYATPPAVLNGDISSETSSISLDFLKKLLVKDPFWFPSLDSIPLGTSKFQVDFSVFKELLRRHQSDRSSGEKLQFPQPSHSSTATIYSLPSSKSSSSTSLNNQSPSKLEWNPVAVSKLASLFSYSTMDPHIQLLFIYIAVLQTNEFKLLEFEEPEIMEFLNNVPMLSKSDDFNFKSLYREADSLVTSSMTPISSREGNHGNINNNNNNSDNNNDTAQVSVLRRHRVAPLQRVEKVLSFDAIETAGNRDQTTVTSSRSVSNVSGMLIEVGTDAKTSYFFNHLLASAGDLWRRWLHKELEETLGSSGTV